MPRAIVLVVDDDEDHRTILAETLAEEGYQVETAVHGGDALTQLRAGMHPHLILLDLMMPEVDGWTFMAAQKRDLGLAAIPVVVFTASGNRALTSAPVAAGYLTKPIGRQTLLQTLETILRRIASRGSPPPPAAPGG